MRSVSTAPLVSFSLELMTTRNNNPKKPKDISAQHQRVGVFVDAQNMYHSAKNLYHGKANFKKILEAAVGDRQLIRAFVYVIKTETGEEKAFFEALQKSGYEIKEKDLQIFPGGMKKADWDVGITVDAIKSAPGVDVIVLVSGDGDFVQLVEYLKNHGKRAEVIAFGKSASGRLKETADEFIDLGETPAKYLISKTRGSKNE